MKRLLILLVSVILIKGSIFPQSDIEIDSLLHVLDGSDVDQKANALLQLSGLLEINASDWYKEANISSSDGLTQNEYNKLLAKTYEIVGHRYYYESELDDATKYLQMALQINRDNNNSVGVIGCLHKLTHVNVEQGEYAEAILLNDEAYGLSESIYEDKLMAESFRNMGIIYFYQNEFKIALEKYFEALLIYKNINDTEDIGFVYNAIGIIYSRWEVEDKALLYFNQAEKIYRNNSNSRRLSQVLNNKADIFTQLNDYEKALNLYQESLELKEEIQDKYGIALLLNNIGTVYGNMEDFQKAFEYLEKSRANFSELDNPPGLIMADYNMGYVYLEQQNYSKAAYYFKQSMNAAKKIGYNDYVTSNYKALIETYAANCDYTNFTKYYNLDKHITDSLLTKLSDAEMLEVEANLKVAEITYENLALKEEVYAQREVIKRNRFFLVGTGTVAFMLLVILIVVLIKKQ